MFVGFVIFSSTGKLAQNKDGIVMRCGSNLGTGIIILNLDTNQDEKCKAFLQAPTSREFFCRKRQLILLLLSFGLQAATSSSSSPLLSLL